MEQNLIQTNCRITINIDVSGKNIIYVKNIIFGILLDVVVTGKYLTSIMDDSIITCIKL